MKRELQKVIDLGEASEKRCTEILIVTLEIINLIFNFSKDAAKALFTFMIAELFL